MLHPCSKPLNASHCTKNEIQTSYPRLQESQVQPHLMSLLPCLYISRFGHVSILGTDKTHQDLSFHSHSRLLFPLQGTLLPYLLTWLVLSGLGLTSHPQRASSDHPPYPKQGPSVILDHGTLFTSLTILTTIFNFLNIYWFIIGLT